MRATDQEQDLVEEETHEQLMDTNGGGGGHESLSDVHQWEDTEQGTEDPKDRTGKIKVDLHQREGEEPEQGSGYPKESREEI